MFSSCLARLKGLILLGGSLRPTPLSKAVGRSTLDLPVEPDISVLQLWQDQVAGLVRMLGGRRLDVRLLLDSAAPVPTMPAANGATGIEIERDPQAYRGTAGILRDLAVGYGDDDFLLVASAGQVLLDPLARLTRSLVASEPDVGIAYNPDGTPSSLFLVKCVTLRTVAPVGFIDFKEQALPRIARNHSVRAVEWGRLFSVPIRTARGYLKALRHHRNGQSGGNELNGAFSEEWNPTFSIVESGAPARFCRAQGREGRKRGGAVWQYRLRRRNRASWRTGCWRDGHSGSYHAVLITPFVLRARSLSRYN